MKNSRWILLTVLVGFTVLSAKSNAQDFDDSIEAELDSLSTGLPASDGSPVNGPKASPTPKPNAKKGSSKPGVGADDFLSEDSGPSDGPSQAEIDVLNLPPPDIMPLEQNSEPPAKKSSRSKPAPKKVAQPAPAPPRIEEPEIPMEEPPQQVSLAPASDEPNSAFENRLASIYAQHSEPVPDDKWSELIGARAAESYSVQTGDTLWDLSQTLFADGFYWSKLWAENPEIQNPHKISKGQAIRFVAGTEAAPPEIRVVQDEALEPVDQLAQQSEAAFEKVDVIEAVKEVPQGSAVDIDMPIIGTLAKEKQVIINEAPVYQQDMEGKITQAELEAGVVIEQGELIPRPDIPGPSTPRSKALLNLPSSFEEYRPRPREKSVSIQRRNNAAEKVPGAIVASYIAFEKAPEPLATVGEAEAGELFASIGQFIIIEGNEPLEVGSYLYSVSERHKITSPVNGGVGRAYEIGGIVQIIDVVDEAEKLYRGRITYAVNPVRVGSSLLGGSPPRVPVSTRGRRVTSELIVAGGSESELRRYFGDGAIIFLDTNGASVQVGDVLSVQARRGERKNSIVPNMKTPIGIVKIFAVSGDVASAVVVLATEEIRIGDRTGPTFPSRLPDLVQEAPRVSQAPAQ